MKNLRPFAVFLLLSLFLVSSHAGVVLAQRDLSGEAERVIVLYKKRIPNELIDTLTQRGADLKRRFSIIPALSLQASPLLLKLLANDPNVQGIYEDMHVHSMLDASVPQIGADQVQDLGINGTGVKVCIVDTGVDDRHPALNTLVKEIDYVNNDNDATDDNGHGTHVAGIISSHDATYRGVAPNVSLMVAKVLDAHGGGFASDVIAGIDWCVSNGADVINMSLGGGVFTGYCDDEPLAKASNNAVEQGVVTVIASGNDGRSDRVSSPGCASKVVTVGAVDKNDRHASYSNAGPQLNVVAPGTSIQSTYPLSDFVKLTGTSMATPHVAGVSALILQADPTLTPAEVKLNLQSNAVDLGASGFDYEYGYGRVDALASVQEILGDGGGDPPPPPPPPNSDVFFDDFQNGLAYWTESNEFNWETSWEAERSVPGSDPSNEVAHADRCSTTQGCILTMKKTIDLSGLSSAELSFWRFVDHSIDDGEFLTVEINNGSGWQELASWGNGTGNDDSWHQESYVLPVEYLNSTFGLRFRARANSFIEDLEVDDVRIAGTVPQILSPTANAGIDSTTSDSDGSGVEAVTLDGSKSSDPDGAITMYTWQWDAGSITTGNPLTNTEFSVGTHEVTLTVTDNDGETDTDTVQVIILPNSAPTANAGDDQTVGDGDNDGFGDVVLDGTLSSDPDGSIVSSVWYEDRELLGTGSVLPVTLPQGEHTITLSVTDNAGALGSDTVVITVTGNQSPIADAGGSQSVSDADNDGSEVLTLDGSGSFDPDGTITGYIWMVDAVPVSSGSALLQYVFTTGTHSVELQVEDNAGAISTDTVSVDVTSNSPPVADAGKDQIVEDTDNSGSESVTLDGSASTDSDGTITSYEWDDGNSVISSSPSLSLSLPVGVHTFTLTVTDDGGESSSDSVDITVLERQVAPEPEQLLFDDFENGLAQWNAEPNWSATRSSRFFFGDDFNNQVAHTNNCDSPCTLTLAAPINLNGYTNAVLNFRRYVDRSIDEGEYLSLQVFDGASWQTIAIWTDGAGDDDVWVNESIPLPDALLSSGFSLRFVSKTSSIIEDTEVDDFGLIATPR